jgi:hypothetical protein
LIAVDIEDTRRAVTRAWEMLKRLRLVLRLPNPWILDVRRSAEKRNGDQAADVRALLLGEPGPDLIRSTLRKVAVLLRRTPEIRCIGVP